MRKKSLIFFLRRQKNLKLNRLFLRLRSLRSTVPLLKKNEPIISVPSVIKSPEFVQSNHTSAGHVSIIKESAGKTDTIIDIPDEDETVNDILNSPLKNTGNKTIFIQNNADISVTNHNFITTANGISCQSAAEEDDSFFEILNRIG